MEWQPIETAPKDGRQILGYFSDVKPAPIGVIEWDRFDAAWCCTHDFEEYALCDVKATHWMPLPEPPE